MKLLCNKNTGEVMTDVEGCPENDSQIYADAPFEFSFKYKTLWTLSTDSMSVIKKTGTDLEEAMNKLGSSLRRELVNKYAGSALNPVTLGNLEGATDILVAFMNKIINGESFSVEEKEIWNSFYQKVSPHFKTNISNIPNEEDRLANAKAAARQAEIDMKNDPDWNI